MAVMQSFCDGMLQVCGAVDCRSAGGAPLIKLRRKVRLRYSLRTVGVKRHYAAMQAGVRIDLLVRCPYRAEVSAGDTVICGGTQYVITLVQVPEGITPKVMDLTLQKSEVFYELL